MMSKRFSADSSEEERQEAERNHFFYTDNSVSRQDMMQRYSETSSKYDGYMTTINFNGPVETATTVSKLFPINRENVYILDVAAGTGLCGVELKRLGFRKMDALDGCKEMLDEAQKKGIYGRYIHLMLGEKGLENIEKGTYDAITICGMSGVIMKRLPLDVFKDIIRIVKPGGFVINTGCYSTFQDENGFMKHMKSLESQRYWKRVDLRRFSGFSYGDEGVVSVHKVC